MGSQSDHAKPYAPCPIFRSGDANLAVTIANHAGARTGGCIRSLNRRDISKARLAGLPRLSFAFDDHVSTLARRTDRTESELTGNIRDTPKTDMGQLKALHEKSHGHDMPLQQRTPVTGQSLDVAYYYYNSIFGVFMIISIS